ncbi:MAG: SAM-dependent methyltransferase [Pseudonocardiales bacterium]|nr:SAM-dependent methyltransferase [Pseudonocardiales bacterium]
MLEYDAEAAHYDETRGGLPRATEAAEAVLRLVSPGRAADTAGRYLDIAGGTGIVSAAVAAASGGSMIVADLSHGMLRKAAERLPGRAIQARAEALPIASASIDVVTAIWLLHLLPDAAPIVDEVARVLRPGGRLVTTVDKNAAHGHRDPDAGPPDGLARLTALAAAHGMALTGTTTFAGVGQLRPDGAVPTFTVASFAKA